MIVIYTRKKILTRSGNPMMSELLSNSSHLHVDTWTTNMTAQAECTSSLTAAKPHKKVTHFFHDLAEQNMS